jgi:hypothetical protein
MSVIIQLQIQVCVVLSMEISLRDVLPKYVGFLLIRPVFITLCKRVAVLKIDSHAYLGI